MTNLAPSMRLKVKRDTFFLPDPNRGVYFRNNLSSFRMEGSTIIQWIEKLLPMLNGEHTLSDLTDGLPGPYRDQVFEIAKVLYRNGFVRDVSRDLPHQLTDQILKRYASQIEFLDSFVESGAHRFQAYRQVKALAVGSGPFLISLVSALIESGLPKFAVLITDSVPTNRQRLMELVAHARKTDDEVAVEEITLDSEGSNSWKEVVQPFDSILYVSQVEEIEELRELHAVCRNEKKNFLPAISCSGVGIAGPVVNPESIGCWESAWHRIHQSVFEKAQQNSSPSPTAGAMLTNVVAFELFKRITGVKESDEMNRVYLLDLETLEGSWHPFIPHPLVTGRAAVKWVQDFNEQLEQKSSRSDPGRLFMYFSRLTSAKSGIFHSWEEGDLKQLPLAQCRVQVTNPISDGPADLLPDIVCTVLTHEEARKEAGLSGIEGYASTIVSQLVSSQSLIQEAELKGFIGVGAGETFAECICRGLQRCLDEEFSKQPINKKSLVSPVQLGEIEDEHCKYFLQALSTMQGPPDICLGEEVSGFPVVWVRTTYNWYGCVGLNMTMALRNALQQALIKAQNQTLLPTTQGLEMPIMFRKEMGHLNLEIPACGPITQPEVLLFAMQVLERNQKRLLVLELELEPFLKEELAGVFGVVLREEESG